jgi:ferric-dicitrate binding protein FerR (iron transport regulator)
VRFKQELADLALDIETGTATVRSTARNNFVVGHDPDKGLTVVNCAQGRVTVVQVNPNLSSVTLETGQQVMVKTNSIGPITSNPLNSFLPFLMK